MAGDEGLTEEDLGDLYDERAVEALLASGLLERIEARLHPGGPAKHFNRLRPL